MKAFGWQVPVWTCAVVPQGSYLAKAELDQQLQQQEVVRSARQEAAALLWGARAKRHAFYQKAQADAHAWYLSQIQSWTIKNQEKCEQAIQEAVQWAVQEDQIEVQVYHKMMETLRIWLQKTLNQWTQQLNWGELLAERIRAHLSEQANTDQYTLSVAPESEPIIEATYGHQNTIRIQVDPQLKPGQAHLQTPQSSIAFDLNRQWNQIVKCLIERHLES